jgi:acyl carrier protein
MPTPDTNTFTRVKKIITEQLAINADQIQLNSRLVEDLAADSLDMVELTMAFEEEFNIEIPDTDTEKILTVGDAVTYISAHRNDQA